MIDELMSTLYNPDKNTFKVIVSLCLLTLKSVTIGGLMGAAIEERKIVMVDET